MNVSALDNLNSANSGIGKTEPANAEAIRNAARQFEAVLLMQLTASLNAASDDDGEEKLFGSDGGSGLAQKMFSEQLATTMAESGGVGLADMIMQKFGVEPKAAGNKKNDFAGVMAAIKDIKQNLSSSDIILGNQKQSVQPAKNRVNDSFNVSDPDEFQVVSTFSDEIADETDAKGFLTLDGQILNSTRPRFVPDSVQAKNGLTSALEEISPARRSPDDSVFKMPVSGRISSDFGTRFHPIDRKMKFHAGIDIAVPKGTPIGAAQNGVVKFAGWKGGYGNVVIVEHSDGTETFYGHNEKLLVAEGQKVSAGEIVSLSGSTGKSTGPHLHFEVRVNGVPVNPHKFLSNVLSDLRR